MKTRWATWALIVVLALGAATVATATAWRFGEIYLDGNMTTASYSGLIKGNAASPATPYAGTSCPGQAIQALDANGAATTCVSSGGAPTDAKYIVQEANAGLSAEQSLGLLTTGLTLNTVTAGVGVLSTYGGTACTNQILQSVNASGTATCSNTVSSLTASLTTGQGLNILTTAVDSQAILSLQNDAQNWLVYTDGASADNFTVRDSTGATTRLTLSTAGLLTLTGTMGISSTAPSLTLTDTTAAAKSLKVDVDANVAQLREAAGASGSLLALDLANNRVGIGTTTPGNTFHLYSIETADVFAGMGTNVSTGPALNFGYAGNSFGRGAGFFNARPDALATAPNPSLRFMTADTVRMMLRNDGTMEVGAPTGGGLGAGTVNAATGYYVNATRVVGVLPFNASAGGLAASATIYSGISATSSSTEGNSFAAVPGALTINHFKVRTTTAQPATGSLVFTLRKNGIATALTLTIAAGGAGSTYSSNTSAIVFAAGDLIGMEIINNATSTSAAITGITSQVVW